MAGRWCLHLRFSELVQLVLQLPCAGPCSPGSPPLCGTCPLLFCEASLSKRVSLRRYGRWCGSTRTSTCPPTGCALAGIGLLPAAMAATAKWSPQVCPRLCCSMVQLHSGLCVFTQPQGFLPAACLLLHRSWWPTSGAARSWPTSWMPSSTTQPGCGRAGSGCGGLEGWMHCREAAWA